MCVVTQYQRLGACCLNLIVHQFFTELEDRRASARRGDETDEHNDLDDDIGGRLWWTITKEFSLKWIQFARSERSRHQRLTKDVFCLGMILYLFIILI